jgi:hypothetical protein
MIEKGKLTKKDFLSESENQFSTCHRWWLVPGIEASS